MSRKKTTDPILVALLDSREKGIAEAERWYSRMKRSFNRLEKARAHLRRLEKRITKHREQQAAQPTAPK